jgi:fatty acid amide hydrolase 2
MAGELLEMAAVELAERIRRREVSSREVVGAHIARIEEVNGALNAVVDTAFQRAMDEAERADERIARARAGEELPRFLGVPCTIKEFLAVEGLSNTAGLVARKGAVAACDATLVARLREAGAIVLGVTNVPEGGMWMETANKVYGRTANPWDLARTPGGSSGGEAAIVAAGGAAFGIGSDIAGSIRIPASFCGIAGHKPTGGWVPLTGHWGMEHSSTRALVCGPMARRARDLAPILQVIAGPDNRDPVARQHRFEPAAAPPLSEVAVIPVEGFGKTRVKASMLRAVSEAADRLADRGARVMPGPARRVRDALAIWMATMREMAGSRGESFAAVLGGGDPIEVWPALARSVFGRGDYTFPALALAALDQLATAALARGGTLWRGGELWRAGGGAARVEALRVELENELGARGVLLVPPYTRPAPRHGAGLLAPFDFIGTALFNLLEFPAAHVPVGVDAGTRLPVGVQIVGRRGNDALVLRVAEALEEVAGGWCGPVSPRDGRR